MNIPPTREITLENATVLEYNRDGLLVPLDDGMDVPGWEYYVSRNVHGPTLRIPIRRENNDY